MRALSPASSQVTFCRLNLSEMQYPEFHYKWEWRLRSTPEQLWPLIADTNRFNRDTGLSALEQVDGRPLANARRRLRFSILGIDISWEEEPFEWVRPQHFGVMRWYRSGPVSAMRVEVEFISLED